MINLILYLNLIKQKISLLSILAVIPVSMLATAQDMTSMLNIETVAPTGLLIAAIIYFHRQNQHMSGKIEAYVNKREEEYRNREEEYKRRIAELENRNHSLLTKMIPNHE